MKLTITTAEAKQVLVNHYAGLLGVISLDIDIVPDGNETARKIETRVNAAGPDILDNKIPRIKALRDVVNGYSLADAKYAVENWSKFLRHIKLTGNVPYDIAGKGLPFTENAPF